jgi:hypothetical protein
MRPYLAHLQAGRILAQRMRIAPEIVEHDQRPLLAALQVEDRVGHGRHLLHSVTLAQAGAHAASTASWLQGPRLRRVDRASERRMTFVCILVRAGAWRHALHRDRRADKRRPGESVFDRETSSGPGRPVEHQLRLSRHPDRLRATEREHEPDLQTLGGSLDDLSYLWVAAPLTRLLIQRSSAITATAPGPVSAAAAHIFCPRCSLRSRCSRCPKPRSCSSPR